MELQGLREALKVEVQCHQKLALRGCPVGATATPFASIKTPTQSIAISVVPAKTPVSMVTAHFNGQNVSSSEKVQQRPSNLQSAARQHSHKQVRPKSLIPESLPRSCVGETPSSPAPLSLLSHAAALPTANCTFSHQDASATPSFLRGHLVTLSSDGKTQPSPGDTQLDREPDQEQKMSFMVSLGLVTSQQLVEIQSKRQERKRRSTANPVYSGALEPERKRLSSHDLSSSMLLWATDYPELSCKLFSEENFSWPQNLLQSCVTHQTVREEERKRLIRRNTELREECEHLKESDQRLGKTLSTCVEQKERLLEQQTEAHETLERVKTLIRLIQREQMIQLTMTATTTLPWIKAPVPPPAGPSTVPHR